MARSIDWWDDLAMLQELRNEAKRLEMLDRFSSCRQLYYVRARLAELECLHKLRGLGFDAHPTTWNAAFDFDVEGARVELKASHWVKPGGVWGLGRYEFTLRHHEADVLIMAAVNGKHHWFVVPMDIVRPRRGLAITREDPRRYKGQWRRYLDRWDVLEAAAAAAPPRGRQLRLGENLC